MNKYHKPILFAAAGLGAGFVLLLTFQWLFSSPWPAEKAETRTRGDYDYPKYHSSVAANGPDPERVLGLAVQNEKSQPFSWLFQLMSALAGKLLFWLPKVGWRMVKVLIAILLLTSGFPGGSELTADAASCCLCV